MSQLNLLLTHTYSKQHPSQAWWGRLSDAQRQYHKAQYYAFTRKNGQRVILSEQDLVSTLYERHHNV